MEGPGAGEERVVGLRAPRKPASVIAAHAIITATPRIFTSRPFE